MGGTVTSPQDFIASLLNSVLGDVPGGAQLLAPWLTTQISRFTGIGPDQLTNPLWSDMSAYGTGQYQLNQFANRLGGQIATSSLQGARDQLNAGFQRMLMSEKAWADKHQGSTTGYQDYIDSQVRDMQNNPFWRGVYWLADPLDERQTSAYLSMASSNLMRAGLSRGDLGAVGKTKQLMNRLFTDQNDKYSFDKKQFGDMSQTEVAALTAALTKDADLQQLTRGADLSQQDAGKLKDAAEGFKKTVESYAKALGPLKDVFGKDIPGMVRAMEEMSGQTLAQMSPERAHQIAQAVTDRVATGRYSMEEVSAMTASLHSVYSKMDVSSVTRLMAPHIGLGILDAVNGGVRPETMTAQDFSKTMADMRIRQSAATNTQNVAKAYALWKERQDPKADSSFSAFREQANAMGYQENATATLLQMAGVTNTAALNAGFGSAGYTEALESGNAASMTNDAAYRKRQASAIRMLSQDDTIRRLAGDNTYAWIRRAMAGADINSELLNPHAKAAREAFFADNNISGDEARTMELVWNNIAQNDRYKQVRTDIYGRFNERTQIEAADRADRLREAAGSVSFSSNGKEFLTDIISHGFDAQYVKDKIGTSGTKLKFQADKEFLASTTAMAGQVATGMVRVADENKLTEEEQQDRLRYASKFADYATSTSGVLNTGFTSMVESWQKVDADKNLSNEEKVEQKRRYAMMANAYMNLGEDAVNTFLGKDEKLRNARMDTLIKAMTNAENPAGAVNLVHNAALAEGIGSKDNKQYSNTLKTNLQASLGWDSSKSFEENLDSLRSSDTAQITKAKEWFEAQKKAGKIDTDAYNEGINTLNKVAGMTDTADKTLESVLERVSQVLSELLNHLKGEEDKSKTYGAKAETKTSTPIMIPGFGVGYF